MVKFWREFTPFVEFVVGKLSVPLRRDTPDVPRESKVVKGVFQHYLKAFLIWRTSVIYLFLDRPELFSCLGQIVANDRPVEFSHSLSS